MIPNYSDIENYFFMALCFGRFLFGKTELFNNSSVSVYKFIGSTFNKQLQFYLDKIYLFHNTLPEEVRKVKTPLNTYINNKKNNEIYTTRKLHQR